MIEPLLALPNTNSSQYYEIFFKDILAGNNNYEKEFIDRWLQRAVAVNRSDVAHRLLDMENITRENLTLKERLSVYYLLSSEGLDLG